MHRFTECNVTITSNFCPKCGSPSDDGELCRKCRAKDLVWCEIPPRLECTICPTCNSVKTAGLWADSSAEKENLAYTITNTSIKIHPDVKNVQKSIDIRNTSSNRSLVTSLIVGELYGIPVSHTAKIKFIWIHEQCDRCSRIMGSYYEGVVQVRATGRKPKPFELKRAAEIAYQVENQMQTSGDRLSFISSIDNVNGGIDITFSSQAIGNAIAHDIAGALGGGYTTHPKLVGERRGIRLYRVTYSLRLPRFSKGDIIIHDETYCQILRQMKETIFVRDLKTGINRSFREDDEDPLIGNFCEAEATTVVYHDAGVIGILDPKTNKVLEAPDHEWIEANAGDTLFFIRDKETVIPLGKSEPEKL
ncbi:MAG TPA: 60S ribosomal export protein NMD3 [Methanocorpusculum sp.]|nr:60S ribosomal export protein NMD3 [Methanocorpusculum sp.]